MKLKTVRINGVENKKQEKAAIENKVKGEFSLNKFKDVIKSQPEYDQIMLWRDFDWNISAESQQQAGENIGDKTPIWIRRLSRFTIEHFDKFIDWLNEFYYSERLKESFRGLLEHHVADIEGYKIPRHLSRFLVLLRRGHGDICHNSKSTPEMKSSIFGFICKVLESMSSTTLASVTKDDLQEWFFYINYAKRRGFNTEYMFDHLKDVARAFVGLQATAERNGIEIKRLIQADDILKLRHELECLKAKSNDGFINWGEFTMECLNKASKFMDKDHVAVHGLYHNVKIWDD